jgi:ribonucleoside-diphosphate reductase alpha chain
MQCCNLSEIIVRPEDAVEQLKEKARVAALLGTLQSALTDIRYLRPSWKKNMEEERLLGVSFTGILDNWLLTSENEDLPAMLEDLKKTVVDTNKKWADKLGIPQSTATTCVKPSGTVSQLASVASGIHPRYAKHYIRRVRADVKDPLATWMMERQIPSEVDTYNPLNHVFSFPIKSPDDAITRNDMSALEQLHLWMTYRNHWCEHNPSITVYVSEEEWFDVGAYVYENFGMVGGVSFLPREDGSHSYVQAPYEEITALQYEEMASRMPNVTFSDYRETDDMTVASQELACTSGACEL